MVGPPIDLRANLEQSWRSVGGHRRPVNRQAPDIYNGPGRCADDWGHLTTILDIVTPDVEEDVGLLVKNRTDITDGHRRVVHLVPLSIAALDVAVVVAGVAAEARVDENGVQVVYQWIPMRLGHVGAQVEVLSVPHILGDFTTVVVGESLE